MKCFHVVGVVLVEHVCDCSYCVESFDEEAVDDFFNAVDEKGAATMAMRSVEGDAEVWKTKPLVVEMGNNEGGLLIAGDERRLLCGEWVCNSWMMFRGGVADFTGRVTTEIDVSNIERYIGLTAISRLTRHEVLDYAVDYLDEGGGVHRLQRKWEWIWDELAVELWATEMDKVIAVVKDGGVVGFVMGMIVINRWGE